MSSMSTPGIITDSMCQDTKSKTIIARIRVSTGVYMVSNLYNVSVYSSDFEAMYSCRFNRAYVGAAGRALQQQKHERATK